jgi:hypothetical protein
MDKLALHVVQGYGVLPCRSQEFGSVDQQQLRYIQLNGFSGISPRELFESDLIWQLQMWRAAGERIILMMDINCHVLRGRLSRALTHESIGLHKITKDHLGYLCPNTHASGSGQIDGVWATSDVTITAVISGCRMRSSREIIELVFLILRHYRQLALMNEK